MYNQIRTALKGVTLHHIHVNVITVMLEWWAIRHLYTLLFAGH
jgi:hypothetical protein